MLAVLREKEGAPGGQEQDGDTEMKKSDCETNSFGGIDEQELSQHVVEGMEVDSEAEQE